MPKQPRCADPPDPRRILHPSMVQVRLSRVCRVANLSVASCRRCRTRPMARFVSVEGVDRIMLHFPATQSGKQNPHSLPIYLPKPPRWWCPVRASYAEGIPKPERCRQISFQVSYDADVGFASTTDSAQRQPQHARGLHWNRCLNRNGPTLWSKQHDLRTSVPPRLGR
jgi:hypothetical protein